MILTGISILLNAYKDLEKELTHLFNEVSIFIFTFKKCTTNEALKVLKTCTAILGIF